MQPKSLKSEAAIDEYADNSSIATTECSFAEGVPLSRIIAELPYSQSLDGRVDSEYSTTGTEFSRDDRHEVFSMFETTASSLLNSASDSSGISSLLRSSAAPEPDVANMRDFLGEYLGEDSNLPAIDYTSLQNILYPTGINGEIDLSRPPPLDLSPDSPSYSPTYRPDLFDCDVWPSCVSRDQHLIGSYFPSPPSCLTGESSTITVVSDSRNILDFEE